MNLVEIRPSNLDPRVIDQAAAALADGQLVGIPTDSNWSVACDSRSRDGVARLKKLKGLGSFTPTVLTDDLGQWNELVDLDTVSYRLVKPFVPGPYVFIFPARPSVKNHFGMKRLTVGLRLPDHSVPRALVKALGRPLFAITASRHLAEPGWWDDAFAQEYLFEEAWELEDLALNLVLDPGEAQPKVLTTVVDLTEGHPVLVREGLGPWDTLYRF